jgi:hypothetical protein
MGGICSTHEIGEGAYKISLENLKVRNHVEDIGADEKIILGWILGKQCGKVWTGFVWPRIGTSSEFM